MTKTINLKYPENISLLLLFIQSSAAAFSIHPTPLHKLSFPNFPISMSITEEQDQQEQEEDFSFPVSSSSAFIESPRLQWRRVPPTANSTPLTRLELLRSKYQRRSFSYMENDSAQMMTMMMRTYNTDHNHSINDEGHDINKLDLLWEDLHDLPKTKKYFDEDDDSSDLDQVATNKKRGSSLPARRPLGSVAIFKVLKKLFYVKKTGSSRSI